MKSMEVSVPGSLDQFELKTGVLCSNPWNDYARGFIGLKHITIIYGQLSVITFDFIWSWKIYPSESE